MDALFPLHPRFVHFPIAFCLAGAMAIGLGIFARRSRWWEWGRISLFVGWLGILAAIVSGLMDQSRVAPGAAAAAVLDQHITVGIALLVVFGLALYWPLRDKKLFVPGHIPWPYLGLLLLGAALVLVEGWLGGRLVYHFGVGVK